MPRGLVPRRAEPAWRATARADLLRQLGGDGCALCRARSEAERQWTDSFIRETNADPAVRAAIRAARGFCAAHHRLIAASTEASFVLTIAYEEVAAERIADLADRRRGPTGPCPPCAADGAEAGRLAALTPQVADPAVRSALVDGDGLCATHWGALRDAVPVSDLPAVLDLAAAALTGPVQVAADDPDAARRAPLLRRLLDEKADPGLPAPARVLAELDAACCPLCRATAAGAAGYLRWLAALPDADRARLEPGEHSLCDPHLHDAATVDAGAAGWITGRRLAALRAGYARATAELGGEATRRAADEALRPLRNRRPCPACQAAAVAADRTAALLAAGLHDRRVADQLAHGHGLCVDHAPRIAGTTLPVEVLRARLELLRWELVEAHRRRGWRARHEPAGAEGSAWLRAPTLLAGDAYLGQPADAR